MELSNLENCTPKGEITEFVPNYLLNPVFPYSEGPIEFATRIGIQRPGLATQDCGLPRSDQITFNGDMSSGSDVDNIQVMALDKTACSTASTRDSTLVVKCRIADSGEMDFVEIELNQQCLNYEALIKTCATELNVDPTKLKKIRKLPNTIVRNDRDVKRLVQYQELEIVIQ